MENRSVTIDLKPQLQDYLYHEFGCDRKEDGVLINCTNDLGILIRSMVTVSDRPPKLPDKENPIKIYLPINAWNHFIFEENFIYIPQWKERMIQDYIEASFRLRIREFFNAGYEKFGFKQKHLVNAFCNAYNIKHDKISTDMITKYDQRNRKKIVKEVKEKVQLELEFE